jgi:hypothetical protein
MRSLSIINMKLPVLIKTPYKNSCTKNIHNFAAYEHKCQKYIYIFQDARDKTLIRKTPEVMQLLRGVLISTQP